MWVLYQTILTQLFLNNSSSPETRQKTLSIKKDLKQCLLVLTQLILGYKFLIHWMINKNRKTTNLLQRSLSILNIACISKKLNSSIIQSESKLRISSITMSIQTSSSFTSKTSFQTVGILISLKTILNLALWRESSVRQLTIVHYKIKASQRNKQSLLNLRWWCCN